MLAQYQPVPPPLGDRRSVGDEQDANAARLMNRRLNFFHAERFSQSEISYFPSDFDPGPEYD